MDFASIFAGRSCNLREIVTGACIALYSPPVDFPMAHHGCQQFIWVGRTRGGQLS